MSGTTYTVFELYETTRNAIGSVTAGSHTDALEKAHSRYGGPIEVEPAN